MRDAAFGCDWVGTAIPFQGCLMFIIATANKEFRLTAGKFVPVSNVTTMNVCIYASIYVCIYVCSGFGGLGVACWLLVPKFAGSNPAEAFGFVGAKKSSARLPSEGK